MFVSKGEFIDEYEPQVVPLPPATTATTATTETTTQTPPPTPPTEPAQAPTEGVALSSRFFLHFVCAYACALFGSLYSCFVLFLVVNSTEVAPLHKQSPLTGQQLQVVLQFLKHQQSQPQRPQKLLLRTTTTETQRAPTPTHAIVKLLPFQTRRRKVQT